jgi:PII-like signaling protein
VLRGAMGYGAHSRLHTFKIERLAEDLPLVLEFVDSRETLERFLADVDAAIREGLATLEKAEVRFYRKGAGSR